MGTADKRLRALAVLAGLLGVLSAVVSGFAGRYLDDALASQALAAGKHLWLADSHGLMQIDAQGKLVQERSLAELGVKAIGEIHAIDTSRLVLAEPGSARLKLLDADKASVSGDVKLSAPPPEGPIRLASRIVGQRFELGVVLDGGVGRFDDQGQLLERSKPGEVRQAMGLLFDGEAWWAADSARVQLAQLGAESLTLDDTVPLSALNAMSVPGMARASQGQISERDKPVVTTLIRHHPETLQTRVVDIFSDATEAEFPLPKGAQALGIAWLNKELWVLDGTQGALWRFDASRKLLGKLENPTISARLNGAAFWRSFAGSIARTTQIAAIVCLALTGLLIPWLLRNRIIALVRRKKDEPEEEEVSDEDDWEARR